MAVLSTLSAAYSLGLRSHPAHLCILLDLSHVSPNGQYDNHHPSSLGLLQAGEGTEK